MNKMKSDNAHIKHLYNTIRDFFSELFFLLCKVERPYMKNK